MDLVAVGLAIVRLVLELSEDLAIDLAAMALNVLSCQTLMGNKGTLRSNRSDK